MTHIYRFFFFFLVVSWLFLSGASHFSKVFHALISWSIQLASNGEFRYRSLEWQEGGKLVFLDSQVDRRLFAKGRVYIEAPRIEISISLKKILLFEIEIKNPRAVFHGPFSESSSDHPPFIQSLFSSNRWIGWKGKITDAEILWPEMGIEAFLSFEKLTPQQSGRFQLRSKSSQIEVELLREEPNLRWDINLFHVTAPLLKPWLQHTFKNLQFQEGTIDGTVHLEISSKDPLRCSSHLEFTEASGMWGKTKIGASHAILDWDGLLDDWKVDQRIRYECTEGFFVDASGFGLRHVDTQLSYYSDLGIKGEIVGYGYVSEEQNAPFTLSLKGFWSDWTESWFDMKCLLSEAECSFNGNFSEWTGQIQYLKPFWGNFLKQSLSPWQNEFYKFLFEKDLTFASHRMLRQIAQDIVADYPREREKCQLDSWFWQEGEISCCFRTLKDSFFLQMLEAKEIKICQKEQNNCLACDFASITRNQEGATAFMVQGLSGQWEMISNKNMFLEKGTVLGELQQDGFLTSKWQGEIYSELFPHVPFSFSLVGPSTWKFEGKLGEYALGLSLGLSQENWCASFQGGKGFLLPGIFLDQLLGSITMDSDGWSIVGTKAELKIGSESLQLEVAEWIKHQDRNIFDLRIRQGFLDIVRLVGEEEKGILSLDPQKTEFLGSFIETSPCFWKEPKALNAHMKLAIEHLWTLEPICQALGYSFPPLLKEVVSGFLEIDLDYQMNQKCFVSLRGDHFLWKGRTYPWVIKIYRIEESCSDWQIQMQLPGILEDHKSHLSCLVDFAPGGWIFKEGAIHLSQRLSCHFSGSLDPFGKGQLIFTECTVDPCYFLSFPWESKIQGQGCMSFHAASWDYELDFDIQNLFLQQGPFSIQHKKPVHAFFSPAKGLMVQGIDCLVSLSQHYLGSCHIHLLHWDPSEAFWFLTQMHVHCPEEAFSLLSQNGWMQFAEPMLDLHHEIDFMADIECASDLSSLSCFIKDGFFPFEELPRRLQNISFHCNEKQIFCDAYCMHQNHNLHVKAAVQRGLDLSGHLILEDQDSMLSEKKRPLQIAWQYQPEEGVTIQSIEGYLGGVDASFYLSEIDQKSHLIGKANLDFEKLARWVPPSIAEVFVELDMGKGYQIRGNLEIERKDLSRIFFKGIFDGKECELFGYRFKSFLSQIHLQPDEIRIDGIKLSDFAGFFTIDHLIMRADPVWNFTIPLLSISEFRPTLLRNVKGGEGQMSPLVIRKMTFHDVKGILDSKSTYTSYGKLHFINTYKRERTLFDIPSEILGRIIGLDLELLVPVSGTVHYVLKDKILRITALEDVYSEGGRSQFFLVSNDLSPTVDFDGNLHIQITMKQYVLFKLTEAFGIFVDGKLNNPQYHLQKKR